MKFLFIDAEVDADLRVLESYDETYDDEGVHCLVLRHVFYVHRCTLSSIILIDTRVCTTFTQINFC